LWELRHAASPILSRLDPSLKSMQFIEDGVVPPDRLADYVRGVRAALAAHDTPGVIFGHAGDAHVHVNPLVDVRRDGWRERVAGILGDVVDLTAQLGGSLSGEHGDGWLRTALLDRTEDARVLELARRVKHAFDPAGLFNPGIKVPLPHQQPLGDIKYDPMLPEIPAAAARVLQNAPVPLLLDVLEIIARGPIRRIALTHVTQATRELREAFSIGAVAEPVHGQVCGLRECGTCENGESGLGIDHG
jgi:hypothetical protein